MRCAPWLLVLGCAPKWIDPGYRGAATTQAIDAAARDHACPVEQIRLRCDATHEERGDFEAYDQGAAVGTITDRVPRWEVELDVCGHVRRYRRDDAGLFGEVAPTCAGNASCASSAPACITSATHTWWAIETSAPEACDDADVEPGLTVTLDGDYLGIALANPSIHPRAIGVGGNCKQPSLEVSVDGQWYALCGGEIAPHESLEPHQTLAIQPGLVVAPGHHEITAVHLAPWGRACSRSRTVDIDVDFPTPLPVRAAAGV